MDTGIVADGWGTVDTLVNVHSLSGSVYSDNIIGSKSNNIFNVSRGNDFYDGNEGYDTIYYYNIKKIDFHYNINDKIYTISWLDTYNQSGVDTAKNISEIRFSSNIVALTTSIFGTARSDPPVSEKLPPG